MAAPLSSGGRRTAADADEAERARAAAAAAATAPLRTFAHDGVAAATALLQFAPCGGERGPAWELAYTREDETQAHAIEAMREAAGT